MPLAACTTACTSEAEIRHGDPAVPAPALTVEALAAALANLPAEDRRRLDAMLQNTATPPAGAEE